MRLLSAIATSAGVFLAITLCNSAAAFPEDSWAVQAGERLQVVRDHVCFGSDNSGERVTYKEVRFSGEVLSAEVLISGFNIWQTKGGDSELSQLRIDAWVTGIGIPEPDSGVVGNKDRVFLKLMYSFKDEDVSGPEDFNDACIGYTVIARTK